MRVEAAVEEPNGLPSTFSMPRASQSFGASCGFSSAAASAGLSVSELNAEITVEIAIVSANCR